MLLAVVAACAGETVEVPGETVVVEKEVVKTIEVPGETVVVEKEVVKTIEVPGETVVKEVVKEVQVPGETVVVEKVVTETVEVPGETVVVKEEVVKTVEVPGETVTVEVVKEVQVPGETVVVEKEVVKTVEVPGETVVVEKEVVQEVAGKKYVTDPTTGKVVVAPQYGGTITFAQKEEPAGPDTVISGVWAHTYVAGVSEKLAMADWATPRDKHDFFYLNPPTNTIGVLAESWSQPDPLTYVIKVRQGVHWHDKPPMNGRELTADDIVYNYHRFTGTGSGFAEPSVNAFQFKGVQLESITATDDSTVFFKLREPNLGALTAILDGTAYWTYPPEVIKEYGDAHDWRNLVGTGPMMLTDWTEGSSITWDKNPDYWGFDEKYPQNRLPYIDQLRGLIMPEVATQLAALRTGRVDYLGRIGSTEIKSLDQLESLQRTNPELVISPFAFWSANGIGLNVQLPHFSDVRVRKAMQMAINLEEANNALYGGMGDMTPQGAANRNITAIATPFEEWPEEVKKGFMYDPDGAEALLDEAGYPRGADGIRFKTVMTHVVKYDLDYMQLVASYWGKIGIDVEINVEEVANWVPKRSARDFEMINSEMAVRWRAQDMQGRFKSTANYNTSNVDDPAYDALHDALIAATTIEEVNRLAGEMDQYALAQFWQIWGVMAPMFHVIQPWLIGYNGESLVGNHNMVTVFTRLWIDQALKEAMGR